MSGGILIDPTRAVLAELRASTDLASALGVSAPIAPSRVWAERVPENAVMDTARPSLFAPMVGLLSAGGYSYEWAILNYPRYELRAYSPQPGDARTLLYVALNAINERSIVADGRVVCYVSAAADVGGSTPYPNVDPPTGTPYFYCFLGASTYSENRS